jgi:hypothetical protein
MMMCVYLLGCDGDIASAARRSAELCGECVSMVTLDRNMTLVTSISATSAGMNRNMGVPVRAGSLSMFLFNNNDHDTQAHDFLARTRRGKKVRSMVKSPDGYGGEGEVQEEGGVTSS